MKRCLFVVMVAISFTSFAQSDFANCALIYDNAIKTFLDDQASDSARENLNLKQKEWQNCLIGLQIPDTIFTTITNDKIPTASFTGKVVVLQFWALWCRPCMAELPVINRLVKDFKNDKALFVSFGLDNAYRIKKGAYLQSKNIPDAAEYAKRLGVVSYPAIYVLSKQGKIIKIISGGELGDNEPLYKDLTAILKEELQK